MELKAKVVPLPQRTVTGPTTSVDLAALLRDYRALARRHLEGLLPGFFEQVDDTLFELADKAETDAIQSVYFDAMREVRLKRQQIETIFKDRLWDGFARLGSSSLESAESAGGASSADTLQLVDVTELEESLAVNGMVEKIMGLCREDLYGLEERLGHCLRGRRIESAENPAGPEAICNAFRAAVQVMGADLKVRLIFLKLFDMHVAAKLGPFYREANELFRRAGVLPDLKPYVRPSTAGVVRPPSRRAAHQPEELGGPHGAQDLSQGDDASLLDLLRGLLAESRGGFVPAAGGGGYGVAPIGGAASVGSYGVAPAGGAAGAGGYVERGLLLQTLSALQVPSAQAVGTPEAGVALPAGPDLRAVLVGTLQNVSGQPAVLSPRDTDIIDVVSLLFEFILDDAELPVAVKALLARLQIPLIKVALLDKEFFAKKGHPARRLVNELARAGLGIDKDSTPEENRRLAKIQEIVERVLTEFTDNLDLFPLLLEEFTAFLAELAAEEAALTAAKAEEYRQREFRKQVEEEVAELVDTHMKDAAVPAVVGAFLKGPWREVLVATRLANADDGVWKQRVELIPDLIWSVQPKAQAADKRALAQAIPRLVGTIREGLGVIDFPAADWEVLLSELETLHLASFRGEACPANDKPPAATAAAPERTTNNSLTDEIAALQEQMAACCADLDAILNEGMEGQSGSAASPPQAGYIEEVVLEDGFGFPEPVVVEDEFVRQARGMSCGTWVEFHHGDDRRQRLKLAWKSDLLGEYTFINWRGQAVDKTLAELADDLRCGRATVIEDAPLIDRALETIVRRLSGQREAARE